LSGRKTKSGKKERRYQRASCMFPAEFTWGTVNHKGRILSVGLGGCFIESKVLVPLHEELNLVFYMEGTINPIKCRSKVAMVAKTGARALGRKIPKGFGLEFLKIFPEDRFKLEEYVKIQVRIFKTIDHELSKVKRDIPLIKELFLRVRPDESTHLNHIKKVTRENLKLFRLRR
jgi:PilZ domain